MTLRNSLKSLSICLFMCLCSANSFASEKAEAESIFKDLFGEQYQAVMQTQTLQDDLDLADTILQTIPEAKSEKELYKLLCEKVILLASGSEKGQDLVINAKNFLGAVSDQNQAKITAAPQPSVHALKIEDLEASLPKLKRDMIIARSVEDKKAYGGKIVEIYAAIAEKFQHEAVAKNGDEKLFDDAIEYYKKASIMAKSLKLSQAAELDQTYRKVLARKLVQTRINRYQSKLLAKPDDEIAAQSLVHIYMLELNQPENAAPFIDALSNESIRQAIEIAVKKPEERSESDHIHLADWYKQMLLKSPVSARSMVSKESFLSAHRLLLLENASAKNRIKANLIAKEMGEALKKFGLAPENVKLALSDNNDGISEDAKAGTFPLSLASGVLIANSFEKKADNGAFLNANPRPASFNTGENFLFASRNMPSVAGRIGTAIKTTHEDYLFVRNNRLNPRQNYSFAIWVKPYEFSARGGIIGQGQIVQHGGSSFFLDMYKGKYRYYQYSENQEHMSCMGPDIILNEWTHIVCVDNGRRMHLYANGKIVNTCDKSIPAIASQLPILIGARIESFEKKTLLQFAGEVDEFVYWNRPLSAQEVEILYQTSEQDKSYVDMIGEALRSGKVPLPPAPIFAPEPDKPQASQEDENTWVTHIPDRAVVHDVNVKGRKEPNLPTAHIKTLVTATFTRLHGVVPERLTRHAGKLVAIPAGVFSGQMQISDSNVENNVKYIVHIATNKGVSRQDIKLPKGQYQWEVLKSGGGVKFQMKSMSTRQVTLASRVLVGREIKRIAFVVSAREPNDRIDITLKYARNPESIKLKFDEKTRELLKQKERKRLEKLRKTNRR